MKQLVKSVKGTRDFYPDEMAIRQWLIEKIRQSSQSFGYQNYDGPCIETIELYAAKSGEELVKEQAFVFPDRGGDQLTLRTELTPTLARMVAAKQNELNFPLRWWSFGPFWRYERPQKGRSREFFQWNIDLIGTESVVADAELVAVAADFFKGVGLLPVQVQILVNDRRLMDSALQEIGISPESKPAVLKMIDRIDKQPADVWNENMLALDLSVAQLEQVRALLGNKDLWQESAELSAFFEAIDCMGIRDYVSYDPRIIRGLDYYTGIVFEAWDTAGDQRAVLGGGHYANLVADVGGRPLPGVGFAMGDVVIQLLLESHGLIPAQVGERQAVFVSIFDASTQAASCEAAKFLRNEGFRVVLYPEPEKLSKQFKYADRLGFKAALVIGPDEIASGKVVVKDLGSHEQQTLSRAEMPAFLRRILA